MKKSEHWPYCGEQVGGNRQVEIIFAQEGVNEEYIT